MASIILAIIAAAAFICAMHVGFVRSDECNGNSVAVNLENEIEVEMLIGDNVTMTCTANKTLPHICDGACLPTHGIMMWFCRENDERILANCLGIQYYAEPWTLKYSCTEGGCDKEDNATTFTMSYDIRHGSVNDSDTYFCVAGTGDECFGGAAHKAMKVSFKEEYIKPQFANITSVDDISDENQIIATKGDKLSLNCSGDGYPSPRYDWIHKRNNDVRYLFGPVLTFDSINKTDGGHYKCVAYNMAGNATSMVEIKVHDKPVDWNWWRIVSVAGPCIVLLALIIILVSSWIGRRNKNNLNSQQSDSKESHAGLLQPAGGEDDTDMPEQVGSQTGHADAAGNINIHGDGHHIVLVTGTAHITHGPNSSACEDGLFIIYHNSSDSSYAEKIKQQLKSHNSTLKVSSWVAPKFKFFRHRRTAHMLSQELKNNERTCTIVVKTEQFMKDNQKTLRDALSLCKEDEASLILSKMSVVSCTNDELPCVQRCQKVIDYEDCDTFWEKFLRGIPEGPTVINFGSGPGQCGRRDMDYLSNQQSNSSDHQSGGEDVPDGHIPERGASRTDDHTISAGQDPDVHLQEPVDNMQD